MLKAYPFGAWLPDVADSTDGAVSVALNVLPTPTGYRPVKSFLSMTDALDEDFQGGAAFIGSDGTASLIAGTASDLYRFSGGAWASALSGLTAGTWYFDQFGDNVIAANGGPLVSYDLIGGTAAAIPGAPTAADVATVRDFVFVLEPDGDELMVQWSAFNDSTGWTPGVDQAGTQPLLSGGRGMKVVGGEYGLVLQKNAIKRFSYVGGDLIFQVDEISSEIGCMARGSVAKAGRLVFFLSERGFMRTDGNEVAPIGEEKFNRWFFAQHSRQDIQGISSAVDPRNSIVFWAMPGVGGMILAYNWALDRASVIQTPVRGVFSGFTANIALDALDAIYGNLDAIPYSLDDPRFSGGDPLFLIANWDNEIGTLGGDNMAATLSVPNIEPTPAQRSRVRSIRMLTDAVDVSSLVSARLKAGDAENIVNAASPRPNGRMPIRANGRFFDVTATANDNFWTYAKGVEMEFEAAGVR